MPAENIKRVEEALQERLHDPGPVDGIIDERTRDALREFQKLNNLPVTGVLDEQTAAKLGGVQPEVSTSRPRRSTPRSKDSR